MRPWAALTRCGLGTLCALALIDETALAGSRFETSASSGAKAAAQLDFTIVIPEVVYLGPASSKKDKGATQFIDAKKPEGAAVDGPYIAAANGGTLAFAPTGVNQEQAGELGRRLGQPEAIPIRVYLVAMP